ncbi:hypothetical protein OG389_06045 [Streptomyces sp. NBC_00435]|uniref:hypothetical protein n=1 Tax=Streptomyces sp. NBC_00435 TaxID=2903649 RepID=UPI002E23BB34
MDLTGALMLNRKVTIVWPTISDDDFDQKTDYDNPIHTVTIRGRLSNPKTTDDKWWDLDTGKLILEPPAFLNLPKEAKKPRFELKPDPGIEGPSYWYMDGKPIARLTDTGHLSHWSVLVSRAR